MQRITRYVVSDLLKIFIVTLTIMTSSMLLFTLGKEALREGLGILPILRMVPFVIPDALRFAVPGTMLFAACLVYGRMAASNEIIAIKSVGVSPWVIIAPTLVVATLVSFVGVWLNDVAVSWGRQGAERVILQSIEEVAYGMLKRNRSFVDDRFSINVKRVEGKRLINPDVMLRGDGSSPPIVFHADEAELRYVVAENQLVFTMLNAEMDIGGKAKITLPGVSSQPVPWATGSVLSTNPSSYPLWKIPQECEAQQKKIEELQLTHAADAAFQLAMGDVTELTAPEWTIREIQFKGENERLIRLRTEPWRRWSNGFTCFCFVIVGVPYAIWWRKSDVATTFGAVFIPILLVYYPILMFSVGQAKAGSMPPYCVWLGNVVLLIIGAFMIRHVVRR